MAENNNKEVLKAIEKLSGKVGDVSEAIQVLATHMDKRFEAADKSADKKIGKLRSDLIDHVAKQVADAKGDIIKTIKGDREKHTLFHLKVLNIFERNNLVEPEEVDALKELVAP